MAPAHGPHGIYGQRLSLALARWIDDRQLGETTMAETGFMLKTDPDTVRAPDLAFIPSDRLPERLSGWLTMVPALVLEVVAADARQADILHKVGDWLDFGVEVVWVFYLDRRCLVEWRSADLVRRFAETDTVVCDDLLPGLAYPLAHALRGLA